MQFEQENAQLKLDLQICQYVHLVQFKSPKNSFDSLQTVPGLEGSKI